jgi:[protein-PII] uridylyltransferase
MTPPVSGPRREATLLAEMRRTHLPGAVGREHLDALRAELFERHQAGAGGIEIVEAYTSAVDDLIRALYHFADATHGRRFPRLNQRVTVIARGGYGRAELNPYSDVDLVFLHEYKPGPYTEVVTEVILHALWDAGLTVGHSIRSTHECVRMAAEDLKEKTAILDSRYLAGDQKLYASFAKAIETEVLNRGQTEFFEAKLKETRGRHRQYGDSIYLLEPQIKEGEGGLRDLHTALWLAKVKFKICTIEDLVHKAIITDGEFKEVIAAKDFLFRLRNSLHFLSKRHTDHLTFEYQERLAPLLGFTDGNGAAASANLMRAYYQQASVILRFSEGLIARVTEEAATSRFLRRVPARQVRPGVIIQHRVLGIADVDLFRRTPLNLITVFADCQAHNVELSGSAYQLVRNNLPLIDDAMRHDQRTGMALMGILSGRQRVAETLEAMHRAGVLGALIPEFGNLYARVSHDLYHIYTVDRHSLAAVRELERLRSGDFKSSNPLLTEVARDYDSLPLVFLALLLHDIGKGYGHDHHERGAQLTVQVCARMGLDAEETDLVVFLVRNHLMMSQVAQKGDVNDINTVMDFVGEVGSAERLKALYLLTFADMRAVAPKVYNNWRDMLLSDLYMRARKALEHGHCEAVDPKRRLEAVKESIKEQLAAAHIPDAAACGFLGKMPDRYFLTVPEADAALHLEMIDALDSQAMVCRRRHFPDLEFSEFMVATRDQPGLFAKVAGVLTANNLNILSARIITCGNGVALDVFRVSHQIGEAAMDDDRWTRVERDLERVLEGHEDIAALVANARQNQAGSRRFVRRVATEVTVDNRSSEEFTVIDVFTQDRVGLLYAITHTLFDLGLVIHLARISTNADQALDVFYVTDAEGGKIVDLAAMRQVREALETELGSEWHSARAGNMIAAPEEVIGSRGSQ